MSTLMRDSITRNRAIGQHEVFEDFDWYVTAHGFTTTINNSGTVAVGTTTNTNGVATITTGVTQTNYAYANFTTNPFLFAAGKELLFETRIACAEAATNVSNVIVGVMNAVASGAMVDATGPKTSGTFAVVWKKAGDASLLWRCTSSLSTTQTTNVSTAVSAASATVFQRITISVKPLNSTQQTVAYCIDGVPLVDGTTGKPFTQTMAFASAAAMMPFVGVVAGSANAEVVICDYIYCGQTR